jgi:hypothetical protein
MAEEKKKKRKPKIAWSPASIKHGVPLSRAHFNAEATFEGKPVRGRLRYSAQEGDTLPVGKQRLKVIFEPEEIAAYEVAEEVRDVYCKAVPTLRNLTSPTMSYGTATTTLSGSIAATIESIGTLIPPTTESVSITLNGVTQRAAIGLDGGFSSSFDTSALQVSGSPYPITYRYKGSDFFESAVDDTSASLAAQTARPTFSPPTAPQPIPYGTPSISLSGTISAQCGTNCTVCPPKGEMVSITINGVTASATIGSNGSFSVARFPTGAIRASATPYTITYSYNTSEADTNFAPATDTTKSLGVTRPPSAGTAQLERAKEDLDAAIQRYQGSETVSPHEAIRALSDLSHFAWKLKTDLERASSSAEPEEHGFLLSFPPEVEFPLAPGSTAQVRVFKPGQSQAVATLDADPKTGEVYFAANKGEAYDLEALLDGYPIQRITLTAS